MDRKKFELENQNEQAEVEIKKLYKPMKKSKILVPLILAGAIAFGSVFALSGCKSRVDDNTPSDSQVTDDDSSSTREDDSSKDDNSGPNEKPDDSSKDPKPEPEPINRSKTYYEWVDTLSGNNFRLSVNSSGVKTEWTSTPDVVLKQNGEGSTYYVFNAENPYALYAADNKNYEKTKNIFADPSEVFYEAFRTSQFYDYVEDEDFYRVLVGQKERLYTVKIAEDGSAQLNSDNYSAEVYDIGAVDKIELPKEEQLSPLMYTIDENGKYKFNYKEMVAAFENWFNGDNQLGKNIDAASFEETDAACYALWSKVLFADLSENKFLFTIYSETKNSGYVSTYEFYTETIKSMIANKELKSIDDFVKYMNSINLQKGWKEKTFGLSQKEYFEHISQNLRRYDLDYITTFDKDYKDSRKETLLTTICDRWFYKFNNEGPDNEGWKTDSTNSEEVDFLKFKKPKVLFAIKGNAIMRNPTDVLGWYASFKIQMLVEDEGKFYAVESTIMSSDVNVIENKYTEWDDQIGQYLRNIMIKPTEKEYDTYKKYYLCGGIKKTELQSDNLALWQEMLNNNEKIKE